MWVEATSLISVTSFYKGASNLTQYVTLCARMLGLMMAGRIVILLNMLEQCVFIPGK